MAENRASADILIRKELSELFCQHVAIRSQMRFLINGINDISIQSNQEIASSTTLNEQIRLYRYLLDDFQEAISRHNELSKRIEMLHCGIFNEEIIIEQKEIEKRLDNIVSRAHNAAYQGLQQDELNGYISEIIEGVNKICESLDVHMVREERALGKPHE